MKYVRGAALLILVTLSLVGATAAPSAGAPAERARYTEYRTSASDRNGWNASVEGEIQFYGRNRTYKVFGLLSVANGSWSSDDVYVAVKDNVRDSTNDGRWYVFSSSCCDDGYLDYDHSTGSGDSRTAYYFIGAEDSGEYFQHRTTPGHGLAGVWIKVCHEVDGPDVCGARTYADNPYVNGR